MLFYWSSHKMLVSTTKSKKVSLSCFFSPSQNLNVEQLIILIPKQIVRVFGWCVDHIPYQFIAYNEITFVTTSSRFCNKNIAHHKTSMRTNNSEASKSGLFRKNGQREYQNTNIRLEKLEALIFKWENTW